MAHQHAPTTLGTAPLSRDPAIRQVWADSRSDDCDAARRHCSGVEHHLGEFLSTSLIGQLVNEAVTADEVVDFYALAGVDTPVISILSDEFLALAKQIRDQAHRNEDLGLSEAEAAFYDTIVRNEAALLELGDDKLKKISVDLVASVRGSVTIDWNFKESVRAGLRAKVRRLLASVTLG